MEIQTDPMGPPGPCFCRKCPSLHVRDAWRCLSPGGWKPLPGRGLPCWPRSPLSTCCFHLGKCGGQRSPRCCMGSLHGGCSPWGRSDSATKRPTAGFSVSAGRGVPKVLTSDAVHSGDSRRPDANSGEPPGQPTACSLQGTGPERGRHPTPAPRAVQPRVHKDTAPGPTWVRL